MSHDHHDAAPRPFGGFELQPGERRLLAAGKAVKTGEEHLYRLGAPPVPAADASGAVEGTGAVVLFVARAPAIVPRFALTKATNPRHRPDKAPVDHRKGSMRDRYRMPLSR